MSVNDPNSSKTGAANDPWLRAFWLLPILGVLVLGSLAVIHSGGPAKDKIVPDDGRVIVRSGAPQIDPATLPNAGASPYLPSRTQGVQESNPPVVTFTPPRTPAPDSDIAITPAAPPQGNMHQFQPANPGNENLGPNMHRLILPPSSGEQPAIRQPRNNDDQLLPAPIDRSEPELLPQRTPPSTQSSGNPPAMIRVERRPRRTVTYERRQTTRTSESPKITPRDRYSSFFDEVDFQDEHRTDRR
jgi:hypothetical protein